MSPDSSKSKKEYKNQNIVYQLDFCQKTGRYEIEGRYFYFISYTRFLLGKYLEIIKTILLLSSPERNVFLYPIRQHYRETVPKGEDNNMFST